MNVTVPDQTRVIRHYGPDAQALVHCEELGELIQSISKVRRAEREGWDHSAARVHLIEEMADGDICLEQLRELDDIRDWELQYEINRKCMRQEERMKHGGGMNR